MKNLKNILSVILAVIIMLTATSTMAYSKTLDVRDEIQISTFISNEKGSIKIANQITGYSLYYQVNEMDSSTYKKIKQLEDELRVIQAFNMYEAAKTQKLYDEYLSTQIYYKNLYGTNVTNCRSQRADEAKSTIIYLLPDYKETWNQTTDNSFNVNLSSFSGTKDFVVWVQLIKQDGTKVYDAEVFELKKHTILAYSALEGEDWISPVSKKMVLSHHERKDGSGYPLKQKTKDIECNILQVCDAFDCMISGMECKRISVQQALETMIEAADLLFERKIVKVLQKIVAYYPVGTKIRLNTGETGIVVCQTDNSIRPVVAVLDQDNQMTEIRYDLAKNKKISILQLV